MKVHIRSDDCERFSDFGRFCARVVLCIGTREPVMAGFPVIGKVCNGQRCRVFCIARGTGLTGIG